jgi:hypothetical protein
MKMSEKQIKRLVHFVFKEMKTGSVIEFKEKENQVFDRACKIIAAELQREADLDKEVHRMMDELERQNPGGFERYKMFPMLKKRLAKQKGLVL